MLTLSEVLSFLCGKVGVYHTSSCGTTPRKRRKRVQKEGPSETKGEKGECLDKGNREWYTFSKNRGSIRRTGKQKTKGRAGWDDGHDSENDNSHDAIRHFDCPSVEMHSGEKAFRRGKGRNWAGLWDLLDPFNALRGGLWPHAAECQRYGASGSRTFF